MRGWVEKRGSSYRINIDTGTRDAEGNRKLIRETLKDVTKKEAEAALTKMLHELNTGLYIEPTKLSFSDYLDKWLPSHTREKLSPMSADRYQREIDNRIKPILGHIQLEKLTPVHIQAFVDEIIRAGHLKKDKPLSPEMITYDLKIVKTALKKAVQWGLIPRNPASSIAAPRATKKHKQEMHILTEDQIKKTLATLKQGKDYQKYVLILLLVSTGLRIGEALALEWSDIDFDNAVISVNKTVQRIKKEIIVKPPKTETSIRKVTIDDHLVATLKRHKARQSERRLLLANKWKGTTNKVFTGPIGGLTVPSTVEGWWIKFRPNVGLDNVRLHDLRHTHATHLLASGQVDIKTISARLGHKNASMTLNTYSHVLPAKERGAASVMAHLWS